MIRPINSPIAADRQNAKRHYGVHPYFTRRPFNVVRRYILHYSKERDVVLDPFGGSGVTAIEAFLENRVGIQNDINPLANFIASAIAGLSEGQVSQYETVLYQLRESCKQRLDSLGELNGSDLDDLMSKLKTLPANIALPKSSDVGSYWELFSREQLVGLAYLRAAIDKIADAPSRRAMLLAWSATLAKLNRTFLSAQGRAESRGGSSIFSIYRYKIAKQPVELSPWKTFEERAHNVIAAKAEIDKAIETKKRSVGWFGKFEVFAKDIDELSEALQGKIDYIFTDPPYGGHISYLDLSTLWNNWLGTMPDEDARARELIVGGELNFEEEGYIRRLGESIRACIKMLKPGAWLSVVFQHWNPAYFEAILSSAAENGAELRATVPQVGDTVWSMHKKKGNESVLAGELILTFSKTGEPRRRSCAKGAFNVDSVLSEILASMHKPVLYGEHVFNELILAAWKQGAIGSLHISKDHFNELIRKQGWRYQEADHRWVRENSLASLFSHAD